MRCLVTAGPTYEPLDAVRRLTNFSTGRLGTSLAEHLARAGHRVTLLRGVLATFGEVPVDVDLRTFTTTADLGGQLESLATGELCAVFHAAAVSDFAPGEVFARDVDGRLKSIQSGKIPSSHPSLLLELKPTPKLIRSLRDWIPAGILVGWKYEVDGSRDDALAAAQAQIQEARTDACVVNGPAYGIGFGLMSGARPLRHFGKPAELFAALTELLPPT